jgi:uncharacterized protein YfkK (UPF0435 family)
MIMCKAKFVISCTLKMAFKFNEQNEFTNIFNLITHKSDFSRPFDCLICTKLYLFHPYALSK